MAHIAKKHILHIAVVHMAATDESCSSTTLYMSKELDKTSPEAAANSCNKPKAGHNDRATVPSAVNTVPKLKRAKFEPKRRQQVANVRKKGACMRCRIKKLPCSGLLPCESCNHVVARVTFDRWEQCVPFSMKEVNIYILDYPRDNNMYDPILGNHPLSIVENVCPSFDDMIEWDVRSISSEFVLWMCDEHAQTGSTSLVGILSSSAFESMLSKLVGGALSRHLKLLVKLTSFLYSSGGQASYADCDSSTLWSLRSFAGTRVLQDLVLALCNASLAAALLEKLTALFLVLFATIIAVGYTEPRRPSGDLDASTWGLPAHQLPTSTGSCTSGPSAESFSEAKKHLLCILAHHLVYIADRLNLLKPNVSRKHIIEGSACRWNRRATFQWNEMPLPKIADTQSSGASSCDTQDQTRRTDGTLPTRYPACCYHLSRSHSSRSSCKLAGGFGTCVHEPSLNIEPSPMDHLLANYPQMISPPLDVQAPIERISTQIGPESSTSPSHPTHRCSSDHLPPITARDGNYAAFERLAETDGMCAPFLCTDDDDNESNNNIINDINEASNMTGPSALTTSPSPLTTTTSTTDESPQSPSTATHSPQSSASTTTYAHNNNNTSTHAHTNNSIPNNQAEPICRSCNFAPLPFATLDQNDLCQFCSALPFPQCSVSSSENTSLLPSFSSPSTTSEMPDLELLADDGWGCGNLLV